MLKLRVFFYQISSSIQPFFSARSLALWSGSPPQLLEFLALKNIVVPYVILKHVVPLKKKSKGATNQSQFSWCIPTVCAVAVACWFVRGTSRFSRFKVSASKSSAPMAISSTGGKLREPNLWERQHVPTKSTVLKVKASKRTWALTKRVDKKYSKKKGYACRNTISLLTIFCCSHWDSLAYYLAGICRKDDLVRLPPFLAFFA